MSVKSGAIAKKGPTQLQILGLGPPPPSTPDEEKKHCWNPFLLEIHDTRYDGAM